MKRPLIAVALLYVSGVLLAGFPIALVPLFTLAFAFAFLFLIWTDARRVLLGALIVLAGWTNLAQRTGIVSPNDLRTRFNHPEESVTLRGVLCETPYHRVHKVKNQDVWSSMARIELSETRVEGEVWKPAHGRVMSSTKEYLPDNFFAGQTVEVTGLLRAARGPVAEGLFDYRNYLRQQGIYHQFDIKKVAAWQITSSPAHPPLADRFCAWARKTLALGLPVEDESLRLEWALTLGWKAALPEEVAEPFVRAATYHIFAVDGLRIAIIFGILFTLLRAARIPRAYCGLLAMPILCFYAGMTGWPASAIRALVMIMIVFGGWALKRPTDLINSLFAAALVILVWEPRQLFQAGFQLSFFVVLCIILILPFFNAFGEHLLKPDPLLPEALRPRWQKGLRASARFVIDLFLTSVAAWLGSIPLVVWYFHLITPLSGPANVLAVPLCMFVLICNLASLLFATWLPFVTVLFNHAGWFFMESIRTTSHWSAHWPGAYFYLPMPGLFTIGLYYLILITMLTGWLFQGHRRVWKISVLTLLTLVWCGLWLWERPVTRLTILPLNGGHAVYLQPAGDWHDWLIDCGNDSAVDNVVKPFLQAQGVNRLSNLLLTHGEINYSGGAESLTYLFHPKNIYTSPIRFRSPDYRTFVALVKGDPAWRAPIKAGDQAGPWTVLYPPAQTTFTKANDNTLVLRAEINGLRILLLSDLSHTGQNALLANPPDLHADIVIAGMTGDSEPLSDPLLDAIHPQAIILADSPQPANKRAGAKLKQRLARRNIPTLYTTTTEAITIAIRPQTWTLTAMDGTEISGTNLSAVR